MNRWIRFAALACVSLMLGGCAMGGATGKYTQEGNAALDNEQYAEAAASFEQAALGKEQPVLAYRGLGQAYMGLARYADAESAFTEALGYTDKRMPQTILDLKKYIASAQYRQGKYDDVRITCDDILSIKEGMTTDVYFMRGASSLNTGELEEAEQNFNAAAALDASNYDLFLSIYECYRNQNISGLGTAYLQSALNIHGEGLDNAYQRGRIYYYLEDYEKAAVELIDPVEQHYVPAMYLMAEIYIAQDDYSHAKNLYEQLREGEGGNIEYYNGLAMCCMKEGKYTEALAWLEEGLKLEGNAGKQELYMNELIAYEKKLDFTTAYQKAEEYVQRYPSDERGQKELEFLATRR